MKLGALFPATLLLCGCQSSVTDADRSPQFLSAVDEPHVSKDSPIVERQLASRLTSEQALKIASDLTKVHHEKMDNYSPPQVTFYPETQHWVVFFPNKRPYAYGHPDTYYGIGVLVDDTTGDASYNGDNRAVSEAINERWEGARRSADSSGK